MSVYAVNEGGVTTVPTLIVNGVSGTGYIQLSNQSVNASSQPNNLSVFANSSNNLAWALSNNNIITLDTTGLTSSRAYALPNISDTIETTNSTSTLHNKTILSTNGNIVEATNIAGFNIVGPFSNGDTLQYNTGLSEWTALTLSANSPLSYASGAFSVAVGTTAGTVAAGNDPRLSSPHTVIVKSSNPGVGEFTSISAAIASLAGLPSSSSPYLVYVSPGVYFEPAMTVPSFVRIAGEGLTSIVKPNATNLTLFTMHDQSYISNIFLSGSADSSSIGVLIDSAATGVILKDLFIAAFAKGTLAKATTANNSVTFVNVVYTGAFTTAIEIDGRAITGSFTNNATLTNITARATPLATNAFVIEGPNTICTMAVCGITGVINGAAVYLSDGATLESTSVRSDGCKYGLRVPNIGAGPVIETSGYAIFNSITNDILIENPFTAGDFNGVADHNKISINPNCRVASTYSASDTHAGIVITGDFHYQPNIVGEITDTGASLINPAPIGTYTGGAVTAGVGLNANVASGAGYIADKDEPLEYLKQVVWSSTSVSLTASQDNYIYVDNVGTGLVLTTTSLPDPIITILLARVRTNSTGVEFIDTQLQNTYHPFNNHIAVMRNAFGVLYSSGSLVTDNGALQLTISSGKYYYLDNQYTPSGQASPATWTAYYHSGGVFTSVSQSLVDNTQYDNGTNLTAIPAGLYVKHVLYIVGQGSLEKYLLVYGQATYASLSAAQVAALPTPPNYFTGGVATIATIIVQQGSSVVNIQDIRPRINGTNATSGTTLIHGNLLGLLADDHPQYLPVNGSRGMSANLNMNSNNIVSAGLVNGVDVAAHASRHLPNGADPITTAAPLVTLSSTSTNSVGTANSLARSDHAHAIDISTFSISSLSGVVTVAQGGTNSSTALNNNRLVWTTAGAIVEAPALSNGQLFIGNTGSAPSPSTLTGTVNQITVTNGAGTITLSLPQNINTTAIPTFAAINLSRTSNQLILGVTNTITLTAPTPVASLVYTIPDVGVNSSFVMTDGAQTINGVKTFTSTVVGSITGNAANVTGVVAIANGGTNSSAVLNNNRLVWTAGGAIVEAPALSSGRIFIGSTGAAPVAASLTGTANQITVTNGAGSITLSLPQNINVGASPIFAALNLTNTTNQIILGTGQTITLTAPTPVASLVYTIPDVGVNSSFVMTDGAQTINGAKTFTSTVVGSITGNAANVTGVVAVANGGTGTNTLTAGNFLIGNGTSAILATKTVPVGTVVGTTDSQLLINKTLSDSSTFIVNVLDSSKRFGFSAGGATTGTTTTLTLVQSANRVITFPDASDTLVGKATTDTLTNKTIIDNTNNVATNSLKTTGAIVNVSSAAPPTANQILTATSATTATWQTPNLSTIPGVLPIASGGTNSSTALNNNRIMVSSGGAIVEGSALTNGQLFIGSTGVLPVASTLTGTANQVIVTNGAGSITLSLPQSIGLANSPTFAALTLTNTTNQLVLGVTNTTTISASAPSASRVYTIPDAGSNATIPLATNTPSVGQVLTATNTNGTASWQTPGSGRIYVNTSILTVTNPGANVFATMIPSGVGSLTFPGGTFTQGYTIRIVIYGRYSTGASPNGTIRATLGGSAITTSATSALGSSSNIPFSIESMLTIFTTGVSGTVIGQIYFTAFTTSTSVRQLVSTTTTTTTINTTIANTLDVQFAFNASNGGNTFSITNAYISASS